MTGLLSSETAWTIAFTLRIAALATILMTPAALGVAWVLSRKTWRGKSVLETLVALPLVMPPVATGLILLKLLGRRGPLGPFFDRMGLEVVFTWKAVVIAMMVMSFPLLVRGARIAFDEVNPRLEQMARSLGAGEVRVFTTMTLPLAVRGIVGGLLLAFARALGEFGATVLVAGNIPMKTSTMSLAIYNYVQIGRDDRAWPLLAVSVAICFLAVWIGETVLSRRGRLV
ncbi:MAG: molybdate ABC transporter permease subunit [Acidobacteriota bacterium]